MFPCSKGHLVRAYLDTIQKTLNLGGNKQPEAASVAKKFSPFSVDSLLATKVKQKQSENNNDENTNETITKTTANHEGE